MKKITSIGYGYSQLRQMLDEEGLSKRVFYGLTELEKKYEIEYLSFDGKKSIWSLFRNNLMILNSSDIIIMLYLYISPLVLLSFLKLLGFYKARKVVVISHEELHRGNGVISRIIHKMVFNQLDVVLFHSKLNLNDSVFSKLILREKAYFFYWGEDLSYIDKNYAPVNGNFFISTGREYRDFNMLLDAFSNTDASLELYTNRISYDNNYEYLKEKQNESDLIKIEYVNNTNSTAKKLAKRVSESRCVVIPLIKNHITYCIGLTSVVEAMALGKPIITSPNPYLPIDVEKEQIGLVADSLIDWINAIKFIQTHKEEVERMGKRARLLAEERYNIKSTISLLDKIMSDF